MSTLIERVTQAIERKAAEMDGVGRFGLALRSHHDAEEFARAAIQAMLASLEAERADIIERCAKVVEQAGPQNDGERDGFLRRTRYLVAAIRALKETPHA